MNAEDMITNAQIAFHDTGLQLLEDLKIKPEDVFEQIENMTNEEQWFGQTLNPIDEIQDRLKAQNRNDLFDVSNQYIAGYYSQVPNDQGREFVKFYLENLI